MNKKTGRRTRIKKTGILVTLDGHVQCTYNILTVQILYCRKTTPTTISSNPLFVRRRTCQIYDFKEIYAPLTMKILTRYTM